MQIATELTKFDRAAAYKPTLTTRIQSLKNRSDYF